MIAIGICDDQSVFAESLKMELGRYFKQLSHEVEYEIIAYSRPEELFAKISEKNFSIVFMDLFFHTPDQDGIWWSKKIHDSYPKILLIILTAYEERMKEGFYARAYRFMTKPLIWLELKDNMDSCMEELKQMSQIEIVLHGVNIFVELKNVIAIEAHVGGSIVHVFNNHYDCPYGLIKWEERLPESLFFRCNRKYLINLCHIQKLSKHCVYLSDGKMLAVSRRKWTKLQKQFIRYDLNKNVRGDGFV